MKRLLISAAFLFPLSIIPAYAQGDSPDICVKAQSLLDAFSQLKQANKPATQDLINQAQDIAKAGQDPSSAAKNCAIIQRAQNLLNQTGKQSYSYYLKQCAEYSNAPPLSPLICEQLNGNYKNLETLSSEFSTQVKLISAYLGSDNARSLEYIIYSLQYSLHLNVSLSNSALFGKISYDIKDFLSDCASWNASVKSAEQFLSQLNGSSSQTKQKKLVSVKRSRATRS